MMLIRLRSLFFVLLAVSVLPACSKFESEKPPPRITAQGFAIDEVQKGTLGDFGSLRVRVESKARITNLIIKERSYEVDLATTPDKKHFPLFGLKKKPTLHTDITLDLRNYINTKLEQPGKYEFVIEVGDKKNRTVRDTIHILLEKPKPKTTPIETGRFRFQRNGKGRVAGAEQFGITWKTVDEVNVTISISPSANGASKLSRFTDEEYDTLNSKEELSDKMTRSQGRQHIILDAANNAAAHSVVGISNLGKFYLLRATMSETVLSRLGTTVILAGEYKY